MCLFYESLIRAGLCLWLAGQRVATGGYHLWTGRPHPGSHKKTKNKTRIFNRDWTEHIKDAGSESYVQKGDLESFWGSFRAFEAVFVGKVAKRTGEKLNSLREKMETTPHVVQNKKNMKRLHHNRGPCVRGLEGH